MKGKSPFWMLGCILGSYIWDMFLTTEISLIEKSCLHVVPQSQWYHILIRNIRPEYGIFDQMYEQELLYVK
jgi:hypothetical protein